MSDASLLFTITPVPFLSVILWIILGIAVLFVARRPFHEAMESLGRLIYNALRMTAAVAGMTGQRLETRNREVLLTIGIEHAERRTEREFERIAAVVERNLSSYPQLQRQVRDHFLRLEADYRKTAEIPQDLADWTKVINAIAGIHPASDPMVATILEEIHDTIKRQHDEALEEHRQAVSSRHTILSHMVPRLHSAEKALKGIEKAIGDLIGRSQAVDQCMTDYETVSAGSDTAKRRLSLSSLTRLFTSGLVLGIVVIGAIINFNLVALPMSEMVGGTSYIGTFRTADVAGVFIVCLEVVLGIFIMDTLGITRLFSVIGSLDDKKRTWFLWILLITLTILAGVESGLAFLRDRMAADMEALRQSLAGIDPSATASANISTIGQMILGFILPFILATAAIPFESFILSARTVVGMAGVWALRCLAFILRLLGNISINLARLVVKVYDLVIFPALWVETQFRRQRATPAVPTVVKKEPSPPAQKPVTLLDEAASSKQTAN